MSIAFFTSFVISVVKSATTSSPKTILDKVVAVTLPLYKTTLQYCVTDVGGVSPAGTSGAGIPVAEAN